jgi:hypothetical protein
MASRGSSFRRSASTVRERMRRILATVVFLGVFAAACLPRAAPLAIGKASAPGVVAHSGHGLRVLVLPYTAAQEKKAFGVDLHARSVMAVEIRIEREAGNTSMLKIRRTGVRAHFPGGSTRDALDPAKVHQRARIGVLNDGLLMQVALATENPATLLAPPSDEDRRRGEVFANSSVASVKLDDQHPVLAGFVYFDLAGVGHSSPVSLDLDFEDASKQELHTLGIPLAAPASMPRGS